MKLNQRQRAQIREACDGDGYERALLFAVRRHMKFGFQGSYFTPEDMVQEAIMKILEGKRSWKNDKLTFMHLLFGTIASDYSSKAKKRRYEKLRHQTFVGAPVEHPKQAYEALNELQNRYRYLLSRDRSAAEFFLKANELLISGKCKTDTDIAREMDKNQAEITRMRKKISIIMESWGSSQVATMRGKNSE
ncbi:MAG: hypothetical protein ACSHXW_05925 [Yoonia sp.]